MTKLNLVTYNVGPDTNQEMFDRVAKLMISHDAAFLGETGKREPVCDRLRNKGYTVIRRVSPDGREAIVFNPGRFKLLQHEWVLMNEGGYAGPGAGPDTQHTRYMTVAQVHDKKTERDYWFLSKHMVASIQNRLRDQAAEEDLRRSLAKVTREYKSGGLFALGDYNMEPDHANFKCWRKQLTETAVKFGKPWPATHDRRHIDHCWYREKDWLHLENQKVIPENRADHDAYSVTFEVDDK